MTEQRIVLDTTVLISALLRNDSPPRWIVDAALQNHILLFSEDTFKELGSRLLRRKFDRYVSPDTRIAFLDRLAELAEFVEVGTRVEACRDRNDDKFLELATDGQAYLIITGDNDLLSLNPFGTIRIVSPRDALDLL